MAETTFDFSINHAYLLAFKRKFVFSLNYQCPLFQLPLIVYANKKDIFSGKNVRRYRRIGCNFVGQRTKLRTDTGDADDGFSGRWWTSRETIFLALACPVLPGRTR